MKFNHTKSLRMAGFSLIELMVVIAIVALLAAVAIPSYKDYINRAKMAEVNSILGQQFTMWGDNDSSGNAFSITTTAPGQYIASIVIDNTPVTVSSVAYNGTVAMTMANPTNIDTSLDGLLVNYYATTNSTTNETSWTCLYHATTNATIQIYFPNCSAGL